MALLLGVAALFVFPPQLLHEFTCHTDSVDSHPCGTEETTVSPQHQHCDILQLFFSPYQAEQIDFAFGSFLIPFKRILFYEPFALSSTILSRKNRGPPLLF